MESAQGLFLNYGTTLKCHFYMENSLSGIELQRVGKIPINSIQGLFHTRD